MVKHNISAAHILKQMPKIELFNVKLLNKLQKSIVIEVVLKQCALTISGGGSRISGKGVHIYKGVGVCFADLIFH